MTNTTFVHSCRQNTGTNRGIGGTSPTNDRSPSDWRHWDEACRHGVSAAEGTWCPNCDCEACQEIDRFTETMNHLQRIGDA